MIHFESRHRAFNEDTIGFLPFMLNEHDPRPAREQLNDGYQHGGGWDSFAGFSMLPNGNLAYPGDEPLQLIGEGKLRDEIIRVYDCSWVAIVQPNGDFEVSRMD